MSVRFLALILTALASLTVTVRAAYAAESSAELGGAPVGGLGLPETVLFMGSSTIFNWQSSIHDNFPNMKPITEGLPGSDYTWLIKTASANVAKYNPTRIVIYSGDNDIAERTTPETVARNFEKTVELIRAEKPECPIYVLSIKPAPGRRELLTQVKAANALVKSAAARLHKVFYVDIFSRMLNHDGEIVSDNFDPNDSMRIHLSRRGYDLWSSVLAPHFMPNPPANDNQP